MYRGVVVVALIVVAGCSAGPGGPRSGTATPTPTPTPTPVGSSSTATTALPASTTASVPTTSLTARPLPARPDTLTTTSVREFATRLEAACRWNALLEPETIDQSVGVERVRVNETGTGYLATLRVSVYSETPGGHADGEYSVAYFVNESVVLRSEDVLPSRPVPDPRTRGRPLDPATDTTC